MKSILSFVFLFAIFGMKSQNNMVVFSENGEKFFLIVNGVKQNIEAETNVKVTDLIQPNYKIKIEFEDKTKGVIDHNVYLMNGGEPVKNYEFVYGIKINKKAGYKIHPVSAVNTSEVPADPSQTVVHYAATEPTSGNNNVISNGLDNSSAVNVSSTTNNNASNVQLNQTTTQTQVSGGNPNSTNVAVNMNGMNVNVNVNDNNGTLQNTNNTVVSRTVTTTTSSSGYSDNNSNISNNNMREHNSSKAEMHNNNRANPLPGYNGPIGCSEPINAKEFENVKTSISSKSFDDTKEKMAKQVMDNNCMLSSQVKEIMLLFSFEATRLDLAKYAYGHTYDLGNYYKLNDAFTFDSSISELDSYIKTQKNKN